MKGTQAYINELLKTHDCVVVPGFGGFVLNTWPAAFSGHANELHPRIKTISFNRSLNVNDGLLAQSIATSEGITYQQALQTIQTETAAWEQTLAAGIPVGLEGIGILSPNSENKIVFSPDSAVNYLKSSYGLPYLLLAPVEKQNPDKNQALPIRFRDAERTKKTKMGGANRSRAALSIAATLFLAFIIVFSSSDSTRDKSPLAVAVHKDISNKSVQPIAASIGQILTQIIPKPAPVQDMVVPPSYCVVGGSFKVAANAEKLASQLRDKGYKATVLNTNSSWYRVSYVQEQDSLAADKDLQQIKRSENQGAWILKCQ